MGWIKYIKCVILIDSDLVVAKFREECTVLLSIMRLVIINYSIKYDRVWMLEWATQEICGMRPQWPWDLPGSMGSSPDSIRGSQGNPTLTYTGVRLRADALVASALQESAGGAKQQQSFLGTLVAVQPMSSSHWLVLLVLFRTSLLSVSRRRNFF